MSFPEQIKNVPLHLVEQGWRREPEQKVKNAWTNGNGSHQWEMIVVRHINDIQHPTTDVRFPVYRPVLLLGGSPFPAWDGNSGVYAHHGWGDGMTPNPEMCKVWMSWWKDMDGLLMPITVATSSGEMFLEFQKNLGKFWRGPVLPPVRMS